MKNKTKLLVAGAVLAAGAAVPAIAQAGGDSETTIPGSDIDRASAAAINHLGGQVDVQLDEDFNVAGTEDEVGVDDETTGDDEAGREDEGAAEESSEGDSESPIPGPDIERASAAAIAHLGGGQVTDTEIGDEESYYEVEVTFEDGRQVDVQLDENFNIVGTEDDGPEDEESGGD